MDKAPDGSVIQESSSDEEAAPPVGGAGKDGRGERRPSPTDGKRGDRNPTGGAGTHPHGGHPLNPLEPPNPIDQLVSSMSDAGFRTNPKCRRRHGLDPDPDSNEDKPKVKIPPPVLREYQVKDLMLTC